MPKIIENPEKRLMEEARKQVEAIGYSAMTIRSVATACGVGVGTVYNYFPSKDALVASYMLEDWKNSMDIIHRMSGSSDCYEPVAQCICEQLHHFALLHGKTFRGPGCGIQFCRGDV